MTPSIIAIKDRKSHVENVTICLRIGFEPDKKESPHTGRRSNVGRYADYRSYIMPDPIN